MINNQKKARNEVLIILVICLILSLFFLMLILKRVQSEQFRTFKNNLVFITNSSNVYQLENNDTIISLKELIDQGIIMEVKNPFNQKESCDLYESRIEIKDNVKETILKCGDYLITKKNNRDKAILYKVGNWQEDNKNKSNVKIGYNYIVNGKLMLEDYYEDYMFLYLFNKHNNTSYDNIALIPQKYQVINQVFYRTKVKIKEI